MLLAKLAVENTTYRFDKPFTYIVPQELAAAVRPGVRVTVPFGTGNRTRVAMVLELTREAADTAKLKAILSVLDREPLLNEEMLSLAVWMKSRYYCTLFEAIKLMIPTGIGYRIVNRYRMSAAFKDYDREQFDDLSWQIIMTLSAAKQGVTGAQLSQKLGIDEKSDALTALLDKGLVIRENAASRNLTDATSKMICAVPDFSGTLSPKQQNVYDTLCEVGTVSVREIAYFTGVSTAVIKALQDKGAAEIFEIERFRRPKVNGLRHSALPEKLSDEQAREAEAIIRECDADEPAVSLLYGVTGSGKTAVFMHVIRHVLERGRSVIVTVPEISLTPQTLAVFTAAFGDTVAVPCDVVVNSPSEVLCYYRASVDREFDTLVFERTDVLVEHVDSRRTNGDWHVAQEVFCLADVVVEACSDAVVEETEVETGVPGCSFLPFEVGVITQEVESLSIHDVAVVVDNRIV